jgi:raffinose/stachyose/melibiose transport system permease protein
MTAIAPPAVRVKESTTASGGRSGSIAWLALPALLMFVAFGVIPLIGVLVLSFTTWDGIGTIHATGLTSWKATLRDPGLPHAVWVTFEIMALSWVVQTPLSILIGVFIAAQKRYRGVLAVL